jgi:hypothetical protein
LGEGFFCSFLPPISIRWRFLINCVSIYVGKAFSTVELILNRVIDYLLVRLVVWAYRIFSKLNNHVLVEINFRTFSFHMFD